jgi:hypothetical protein
MNFKDSGFRKISNPPFKPFIDYRIGDYNTFRKVMLSLIKKNALLAGTSMSKSDKRDYGGALVDMWAYLCDILTYYQERLASESFLRTARLEESVIELLYLVDYLPPRGRSASALVRFVADEKKVPPKEPGVIIPQGFKITSVPAKGQEEAVIFETDESLVITSDHNLMKLDGWRTSYKIEQGTTQLFLDKIYPEINVGDLVMFSDDKNIDVVRIIKKVDKNGKSQIEWTEDKALNNDYTLSKAKIQKFTQLVRPFGYNTPPSILSNVGVTLYKKKSDAPVGSKDDNNNGSEDERDRVANRLAQLVDASDRVVASATSDSDGKLMFKGLIPGSYRIFIARSASITEESQLYPIITAIPSNHFQLLPGFESRFDAELEFGVGGGGGGPIVDSFVNTLKQLSRLLQENPFAEKGLNLAATTSIPFLPQILERIADDAQSDTRPGLTLVANEPYPFDPVGDDILSSQVYLDKVYENIEQGSFVILSKDDPSNQIDTSRQLFKISRTSQMFHAKYGIGGNASAVTLQTIDGKDGQEVEFIFCWEEILEELKVAEKGIDSETDGKTERDVPGKETEQLINFLNEDVNALDAEKDIPVIDENETAIQISDQIKKNVYRIELNEKDKGKATLLKKGKKLLDFVVKIEKVRGEEEEGEEAAKIKTNLYANKIESAFYKIRNTMIFTNPVMEIGVDPRFASQDKTDQNAENITLEGMHTGLKAGVFLAVTDNTSIIQGRVVDSDLHPLEGYRVAVYRVKKLPTSSSSSSSSSTSIPIATTPIEVASARTNADGYFSFNDLRADSYVLSLSLPLEKYWQIFVNYILEEVGGKKTQGRHVDDDDNGSGQRNEKREIINALLFPEHEKIVSNHPTNGTRSNPSKEKDQGLNLTEFAKHHLDAFLELIAIIRRKEEQARPANLESRFAAYTEDILNVISEVETSIKDIVLPLIDAGSDERSSSSSSSSSLLNRSLADCIKIIEKEPEAKLKQLRIKALLVLDRLPNERLTTSSSFVREFIEETIIPVISILEEILIVVKESLQSPFRSTIYQKNELLLGATKTLDLESDTATNFTMKFNMKDRLTYVESMLQSSKLQVTKIAGAPSFSEGKTHLSLDPPLNYRYVKGFAEIYGNMVPASHGETVKDEILGSGDASIIHQEFTIRKGPISIVPSPLSSNGIKSTLKVIVNDVLWQEADDFLDSEPNDQHYVTSLNEEGSIKIVFGDGIRGSTLPTGIDNVHAQYRVGMGFRGNLPPNAPVVPKEKNPAIKSVSIPAGSYGGAEKVLSQQKRSYRPRILSLGRAVSLEDYSNLAKTFGEISKARSYLIMKDGLETVVLVVAGQRGRIVSSALQMELQAYMDERRDIRIPLQIESFVPVPVDLVVEVKVNDSYRRSKVVSNIESRLGPGTQYDNYHDSNGENENYDDQHQRGSGSKFNISGDSRSGGNGSAVGRSKEDRDLSEHYNSLFSFERLDFGQKVTLNDVYAVVENVHGVDFAVVKKFCRRSGGGIGCNGGRCDTTTVQEVISANHNEILQCENDPLDPIKGTIKVVARGGLEI